MSETWGEYRDREVARLSSEMDRIKVEIREALEPLPGWVKAILRRIWPPIFAERQMKPCPICDKPIKEVMRMKPRYDFGNVVVWRMNKFVLVVCEDGHITNRMMLEAYEDEKGRLIC